MRLEVPVINKGKGMSRKSKAAEFVDEGYTVSITGRNLLVTSAMKDYALEKLSKIERFSDRIIEVAVTMDIQKLEHRVDIVMKVDHIVIKSSAVSEDIYASIDMATDKLQRQLIKYRQRIHEHTAKKLSVVDMNVNVLRVDDLDAFNDEIESETRRRIIESYSPHRVVSREAHPLKVLSFGEAIMKMDLSGDAFLIFRSEEDRRIKVIYRRRDNDYGVIEVES